MGKKLTITLIVASSAAIVIGVVWFTFFGSAPMLEDPIVNLFSDPGVGTAWFLRTVIRFFTGLFAVIVVTIVVAALIVIGLGARDANS